MRPLARTCVCVSLSLHLCPHAHIIFSLYVIQGKFVNFDYNDRMIAAVVKKKTFAFSLPASAFVLILLFLLFFLLSVFLFSFSFYLFHTKWLIVRCFRTAVMESSLLIMEWRSFYCFSPMMY